MARDLAALSDILNAARNLVRFTAGLTQQDVESDVEKQSALIGQFVILGEAARRVSPGLREAHPEIPWPKMVGMRNQIAHGYDEIDWSIVWETISTHIPILIGQLEPLVPKDEG
jgi:uncharacterized protein with HEPN domain